MIPTSFTTQALSLAADLGFHAAAAAPLARSAAAPFLRRWLSRGRQGQMDYLARAFEDRVEPRRRFGWARSALVLALAYDPPTAVPEPEGPLIERISSYARGRDYHKVVDGRTRELGRKLEALSSTAAEKLRWRSYVDTGPLLERELGQLGGLGWIGKNTQLLSERLGSYFFLSVLLLSERLDYGLPAADRCGSCRACLDVCPTDAFPRPYELDATRCISYLTIEHRGELPDSDLAGYLFGCDLCQVVCPWNGDAPPGDPALQAREGLSELSLADLVSMSEAQYQRWFEASAMKRAGRSSLRRNAILLAAQLGDAAGLTAARACRDDPDPTVAATARQVYSSSP